MNASSACRIWILIGVSLGLTTLHSQPALAAIVPVTACTDSGPGSLRNAVALAGNGDTIDLGSLIACRSIPLSSGQIEVPQNNLNIEGPATAFLEINPNHTSRIFHHTGTGTLRIARVDLYYGQYVGAVATGGCVHSEGHVELKDVAASFCQAYGQDESSMAFGGVVHARTVKATDVQLVGNVAQHGGAISTVGRMTLLRAWIANNLASTGGGRYTTGGATLTYVWIDFNHAEEGAGMYAAGGSVTINKTGFIDNEASRRCGGVCVAGSGRTSVLDSTFTRNRAGFLSVGELSDDATISNSTIAFNTSTTTCAGAIRAKLLKLQSTIIASNPCGVPGGTPYDVGGDSAQGCKVTGANNLVGYSLLRLPPGTLSGDPGVDHQPGLYGGVSPSLRLLHGSPAVNTGNNVLNRQYDQRGPGHPRVRDGRADIGAYEGLTVDPSPP